ncbi:hypothetical protein H4O14_07110 [Bacillus sp. PAMC26568]|nr:hypothetical protein H4O14_07110 [Bacillus sp. PAMC26568]
MNMCVFNGKIMLIEKKKNASIILGNSGFTLLNMIFSFSIFMIIVSSTAILIPHLYSISERKTDISPLEWEIFLQQALLELSEGTNLQVEPQRISFTSKSGEIIEYEKYGQLVRRQVDGKGHIICLRNIKNIVFKPIYGGVSLTATSITDSEYHSKLRNFHEIKVN